MEMLPPHRPSGLTFIVAAGVVTLLSVGALIGLHPGTGLWWDTTFLAQAQVVSGVLGTALAAVAVIYAWRVATKQFDLLNEQDGVIRKQLAMLQEQKEISARIETLEDKQKELLARQTKIAVRQSRLIRRQAAIAETQHRTWLAIQERFVRLSVKAIVIDDTLNDVSLELVVLNRKLP